MYNGYRVVAVTPAGRRENLEVLETYVTSNRPLLDGWDVWVNTPHQVDVEFIQGMRDRHPGFVRLVPPETPVEKDKSRPQAAFFKSTASPDTVYVKFDDDICWVAPDAVEKLVEFRVAHRDPFFVMANTVMNGYCAYLHAKYGAQDFHIDGSYQRMPPEFANKVWSEVRYAEYVHRTFLADLAANDLAKYKFDSWSLNHYERVAINCIAWMGADFAAFGGVVDHLDEELWMCCIKAKELKRPNVICGASLVAHHAFYKHRKPFAVGKPIDPRILKAYRALVKGAAPDQVVRLLHAKTVI